MGHIYGNRTKLKQIEQECELLKKCCETLGDENRRLKKELEEARSCCSLKFDHRHQPPLPLYIQYPSTAAMRHPCDKKGKSDEDTKRVAVVNGGKQAP
ncbi:Leucine zipper, homeobox-associated [Cynara cardunculus var. scolymus]|uniref:Leucine zipper, homeobox-associated n=1 Tax=Cynara cardunculus var. scolymus TaxID=59895 RepID=A0A103YMN2_CYNCS|nr:Leucine zipper, homeobox-associated [Cynara cardunculus var. scolymus]